MATSVELSDDVEARISRLSGQRRQSPQTIIQEAVQQYVEREEARESLRQDAEAFWADYRATGMYLPGDEARAWLRTWGTEAETEPPPLHG